MVSIWQGLDDFLLQNKYGSIQYSRTFVDKIRQYNKNRDVNYSKLIGENTGEGKDVKVQSSSSDTT